jgi:hypothetical protein
VKNKSAEIQRLEAELRAAQRSTQSIQMVFTITESRAGPTLLQKDFRRVPMVSSAKTAITLQGMDVQQRRIEGMVRENSDLRTKINQAEEEAAESARKVDELRDANAELYEKQQHLAKVARARDEEYRKESDDLRARLLASSQATRQVIFVTFAHRFGNESGYQYLLPS